MEVNNQILISRHKYFHLALHSYWLKLIVLLALGYLDITKQIIILQNLPGRKYSIVTY